jgi:membrane associated rhomboid family serine protease
VLGRGRYLLLYLTCGIVAALAQAFSNPTSHIPMVGASGAIAGVLGAYLLLHPGANVRCFVWIVIFFRIVNVPAWTMLGLWFAMQLVSGLMAAPGRPGVAFWAHVGGFSTGIVLYLLLYLASGAAAALVQALSAAHSTIPMIGASGAIAGVLGAYLLTYPRANVHCFVWIVIFFWIVTVPAWILLGLWFAMQLVSGLATGPDTPGVAFWAHVGGFSTGIVLYLILRPRRVVLLQPQRTPTWATASPNALTGRRTFHRGSVPDAGAALPRRPGPWG